MKMVLNKEQNEEVENIMSLALDWLMAWDVVGEGEDKQPEKKRIAAMHRLKEGVAGLVCNRVPPDAFPQAHRLALELECLLLSCTDTAATAKWWDSAHEALEQWREFCREDAEEVGAGDTALCWRCGREHDEAGYPKCACTGP